MENSSEPSLAQEALFQIKSNLLRLRRTLQDWRNPPALCSSGEIADYPHLIAESKTPLWVENTLSERSLQLGKAENLRQAIRHLQKVVIFPESTFSFWRQIGRATRRSGYVPGRQISEGCLIPAIGGGLCQLSNALYDVALKIGAEIVERHPHSRIVPGSTAQQGRDATVYWNYIDLRFRPKLPILLHAELTHDSLLIRVYGKEPLPRNSEPRSALAIPLKPRLPIDIANHSCQSCGATSCFRHRVTLPTTPAAEQELGQTAYLLEERWAEFEEYIDTHLQHQDTLFIPLDGKHWKRPGYAWHVRTATHIKTATRQTLLRAYRSRKLAEQGVGRQKALLAGAESLARAYARQLTPEITHLCITQSLLPFLWRDGHLGGRTFDVLLTRLPLQNLHATLDSALQRFPNRATLGDFRAPDWLLQAEAEALQAAKHWITPHSALAKIAPQKTVRLNWILPTVSETSARGERVLFLGPTIARKGANEVREAVKRGNWKLAVLGRDWRERAFGTVLLSNTVPAERTSGRGSGASFSQPSSKTNRACCSKPLHKVSL